MIVNGDREHLLGMTLADHVIVQNLPDFLGCRDTVTRLHQRGFVFLTDNVHAQFNAFIADEHRRPCDELTHFVLALAAKRTIQSIL